LRRLPASETAACCGCDCCLLPAAAAACCGCGCCLLLKLLRLLPAAAAAVCGFCNVRRGAAALNRSSPPAHSESDHPVRCRGACVQSAVGSRAALRYVPLAPRAVHR
jgi:hypothetical protein